MPAELEGRIAVITGAGGGLGGAYARSFAAHGARLVLTDREATSAEEADTLSVLAEDLARDGAEVVVIRGDIGDERTAEAAVTCAVESFGGLDVVVNNAGNWVEGPLHEVPVESFDSLARVHLRGHFVTLRAAAGYWVRNHKAGREVAASVVNTTSRSALNSIPGHSAYAAVKGGIIALTGVAANELSPYGVRVNCVAPAGRTAMTLGIAGLADSLLPPKRRDEFDEWDPANVAPLVAYLATRDCELTGQILFARGGTVQRYLPWTAGATLEKPGPWTVGELAAQLPQQISSEPWQ